MTFNPYEENGEIIYSYKNSKIKEYHYNYENILFETCSTKVGNNIEIFKTKYNYDSNSNIIERTNYDTKGKVNLNYQYKYQSQFDSINYINSGMIYDHRGDLKFYTSDYKYDSIGNPTEYIIYEENKNYYEKYNIIIESPVPKTIYFDKFYPYKKIEIKYDTNNDIVEEKIYKIDNYQKYKEDKIWSLKKIIKYDHQYESQKLKKVKEKHFNYIFQFGRLDEVEKQNIHCSCEYNN